MYQKHPSTALNALFRERPFQGAVPDQAQFLFIGLDANYAAAIEESLVYARLVEYHKDGVSFWHRHGVHHPFLLPAYRGDGRRYHLNFARIGFRPEDASRVSFVELLHVPTVGRSTLETSDLDPTHLKWLESLIASGKSRHVFVSASVARLMLASGRFPWATRSGPSSHALPLLHSRGATEVRLHLHFSNYGKFQARLDQEASEICRLAQAPAAKAP